MLNTNLTVGCSLYLLIIGQSPEQKNQGFFLCWWPYKFEEVISTSETLRQGSHLQTINHSVLQLAWYIHSVTRNWFYICTWSFMLSRCIVISIHIPADRCTVLSIHIPADRCTVISTHIPADRCTVSSTHIPAEQMHCITHPYSCWQMHCNKHPYSCWQMHCITHPYSCWQMHCIKYPYSCWADAMY